MQPSGQTHGWECVDCPLCRAVLCDVEEVPPKYDWCVALNVDCPLCRAVLCDNCIYHISLILFIPHYPFRVKYYLFFLSLIFRKTRKNQYLSHFQLHE